MWLTEMCVCVKYTADFEDSVYIRGVGVYVCVCMQLFYIDWSQNDPIENTLG